MSILKAVNGNNNSRKYMSDKIEYLCDATKTDGGKLIDTRGCSKEHVLRDMMSVKKAYHKPHGKQGEHFVISITPDLKSNADELYLKIGREIAEFFPKYQSLIVVHKDTNVRHAHILLNSVSYKDGKKFSQGPKDLNDLKLKCNRVLEKYDLDIIKMSSNDIRDSNKYADREDFDFLEIFDDVPEIRLSPVVDASDDTMFNSSKTEITIKEDNSMSNNNYETREKKPYSPNYSGDESYYTHQFEHAPIFNPYMGQGWFNNQSLPTYGFNPAYPVNNTFYPLGMAQPYHGYSQPNMIPGATVTPQMVPNVQPQEVPAMSQEALKDNEPYPELRLESGQKFNLYVNDLKELEDMMEFITNVPSITYEEKLSNTKIAMAAVANFQKNGLKVNVVLDNTTQFEMLSPTLSKDATQKIDVPYTEKL